MCVSMNIVEYFYEYILHFMLVNVSIINLLKIARPDPQKQAGKWVSTDGIRTGAPLFLS